jgi:hypothetical protein
MGQAISRSGKRIDIDAGLVNEASDLAAAFRSMGVAPPLAKRMTGGKFSLAMMSVEQGFAAVIQEVVDGRLDQKIPPSFNLVPLIQAPNGDKDADSKDEDVQWQYFLDLPRYDQLSTVQGAAVDKVTVTAFPSPLLWPRLACPKTDAAFDYDDADYVFKCPLSAFYQVGAVVQVQILDGNVFVVTLPPFYL